MKPSVEFKLYATAMRSIFYMAPKIRISELVLSSEMKLAMKFQTKLKMLAQGLKK